MLEKLIHARFIPVVIRPFMLGATLSIVAMTSSLALPETFAQTVSDTPRPELWVTNGQVNAVAESCGVLYLGGEFTYLGPRNGAFATIDAVSGQANAAFPRVDAGPGLQVLAVAADGVSGWYVGGLFTSVGCVPRNHLAHILADGTLDLAWNPNPSNWVTSLAVSGNILYVGGWFTGIGAQVRPYVAALDAATGVPTAWAPDVNSTVHSLAVSGNTVYIGGQFTSVNGQARNRIAAINATTGALTAWNPNPNGVYVWSLAATGSTVIAGGDFTSIGGQTRNRIAALDTVSGAATAWDPNASAEVYALAVSGKIVYAGGDFFSIGGQTRNRIAALDATTGLATAWNPNSFGSPSSAVTALAVSGNTVYAGGNFDTIGGQTRSRIAALDATTGAATSWNPGAENAVRALAVSGKTVAAGGLFVSCSGLPRNRLAALDTTTGVATAWNPDANSVVGTLAVSGGTVYAAGSFTSIGGQSRNYIAALDATSGIATAWNPNPNTNGVVSALAVSGATIYAGGSFTSIGGQNRNRLAALDATTAAASPWNPDADNVVETLAVSGSTVYVGGYFTFIGGLNRNFIAAIDAASGVPTAWNPSATGGGGTVETLVVSNGIVYAGGRFSFMGGQPRSRIAAIDVTTGLPTAWDPNATISGGPFPSSVWSLAVSGNTVYVGGYFTSIGGQNRYCLAAVDVATGAATSWNPGPSGGPTPYVVNGLAVSMGNVYAGGAYTSIGFGQRRRGIAGFKIVNADWADAAGLWSNAANWSPPNVPDNTSCDQYNVRIAGAAAQVTLDIDATVNTVSMENSASLLITAGDLTIASPEGITNSANIFVGPGHKLIASTATNICGVSPIELSGTDAAMSSTEAASTIRLSAPVTGFGIIDAAMQNQSNIDANVPGELLAISGPNPATSGGEMRASNGGTLQITRSIGGAGSYVAAGGLIQVPGSTNVTVSGSTLDVFDDGELHTAGESSIVLTGSAAMSCLAAFRGCIPPVMNVAGNSGMNVGGNFLLASAADVTVESTATFTLAGNFDNQSTSPTLFHWDAGPLTMNGAGPQTFEAAGNDLGPRNPAGFTDNFAMGTLRIEPDRTVDFVNAFDNIPPAGCEVLYVDTLSLGAGSIIRLNGCNVYYHTLIKEVGATVVLLNGAALMSTDAGDLNGDNAADLNDLDLFVTVLLGGSCDPACMALADVNGDGVINGADIALFVRTLVGW